jgi:hypothetical protein
MTRNRWLFGFFVLVTFSLACSLTGQAVQRVGSEAFSAQVGSPASVSLEWQSVAGASGYLLEGRYGQGDFFQVAQLAGDQRQFTHFIVPRSVQIDYRLTAATANGSQEIGSLTLKLPEFVPNPLLADIQPFDPMTSGGSDFSSFPTIDPYNPDPTAIAAMQTAVSDMSAGMQTGLQPVGVQQEIGPQGGTLSLTSPNGAVFELEIPEGVVEEAINFSLTPIETVNGFPFARGPLAAVEVRPNIPYSDRFRLTVELPGDLEVSASSSTVGFMVSSFNNELSLIPAYATGDRSYQMDVAWGDTFGLAAVSLQEILAMTARIPSDPQEQLSQQLAALMAFNTDPSQEGVALILQQILNGMLANQEILISSSFRGAGAHLAAPEANPQVQARISGRDITWGLQSWERTWAELAAGQEVMNPDLQREVIRKLAKWIHNFLLQQEGCRTRDAMVANWILHNLRSTVQNTFWTQLAIQFTSDYQSPERVKACIFMFHIFRSSIVIKLQSVTKTAEVHSDPFEFRMTLRGDELHLVGYVPITYEKNEDFVENCPPAFQETPFPDVLLWIDEMTLVFDSQDRLIDFRLKKVETDSLLPPRPEPIGALPALHNGKCKMISVKPAGYEWMDVWGYYFSLLHTPSRPLDHWTLSGEESFVARKVVADSTGLPNVIENTSLVLTVDWR